MSAEPTSILAFRNGSIGNTLAAVPALRALRRRYPQAQLAVVVDSLCYPLLELCPWIDRLIVYDKHGAHRGAIAHLRLVRELRSLRPSHAVLFKRFFRNGLLAYLSGAPVRAGFRTHGSAPFLNLTIPYRESVPVVDLNLELAAILGAPAAGRGLELFLSEHDENAAREFAAVHGGSPYCVALYGGQTSSADFVSLPRFAALVRGLTGGACPIFVIGSGERESSLAVQLASNDARFVPALGLPLRVTAALMKHATLFVGFNSGPAHMAAAVHVPTVILYRPDAEVVSEIRKWCPPGDRVHPLVPPAANDDTEWSEFLGAATAQVALD
ncbi:MAG: glycosyltransferase family 9 protein [bacterium]|nr:glycosyltransferase family 9 protein [bacterium]